MTCTVALSIVGAAGVIFALGGFYTVRVQAKWMASFYSEQNKESGNDHEI
ncbi:hypothetical protein [Cupriavidus alkaliphilus]|uniref:Uncharacterized protein n=1 Tax=Cupriavidus alkaliphilus TaxID=942866 RepID=A0A7W4VFJ3_9BURK|nr:hypothetical protein [Cupriavidus alkaliphilus]MBB3010691.1 hypothetical protein [Cupriavidus alkaliphilus]